MLNFKQFLEEARRRLSVSQTTTAIDSLSTSHQNRFDHWKAPKHIPIPGHRGHLSDEFWDALGKRSPPKEAYKPKRMKLRELTPSQPNLHINKMRLMRKKVLRPYSDRKYPITIASFTGEDGVKRHFVQNGHHRLYPMAVRHGLDHEVRVMHVDLDDHE